ncbi:uncharacterized protein LOC141597112 [Silene latifolia]|uniref:uncharacterized protein LOC141597112 n=1 Tax=Silene latifolia TaxID=37657 RepID=UPI003D77C013
MLNGVKESMCSLSLRNTASQVISLGLVVSTVLMIWYTLILLTGTQSPVIVVISGSMEPGFRRGDILFAILDKSPFHAGEILVFKIKDKDIPIVHRVIKVHRQRDSDQVNLLTKGDNNKLDDSYGRIYANGQLWLENSDIIGRVKGYLPYVGYATIIITEQPLIKYLLMTGFSLLAIFSSTKSH